MKRVYICSPYSGDVENNVKMAREYCRYAIDLGCLPIAPHLLYPQILDDNNPAERMLGIKMGLEILDICDEIWICGELISTGMEKEIAYAEKVSKAMFPVHLEETQMKMTCI